MGELPPITASTFIVRSLENTPLANRASTSANPDLIISPAFMETNYEVLESLPRYRRRQVRNEDLHTELDYYREEYNKERDRAETSLRKGNYLCSLNRDVRRVEREFDGRRPSKRRAEDRFGGNKTSTNSGWNLSPNDSTGCVTPFVHCIKDYPLPDGLKMNSHVGSYNGKGDPDNYLNLFEGAIHMQKWAMLVACHMFTYTLKDSARIWWNDQKAGNIVNYEDLKAKFRSYFSVVEFLLTDLPTTYKGLMEKTYTWIEGKKLLPIEP
nr:reverse transcriptase domain-containing protein [Tanacetum cinerariifolium]